MTKRKVILKRGCMVTLVETKGRHIGETRTQVTLIVNDNDAPFGEERSDRFTVTFKGNCAARWIRRAQSFGRGLTLRITEDAE